VQPETVGPPVFGKEMHRRPRTSAGHRPNGVPFRGAVLCAGGDCAVRRGALCAPSGWLRGTSATSDPIPGSRRVPSEGPETGGLPWVPARADGEDLPGEVLYQDMGRVLVSVVDVVKVLALEEE
jgi:hypothetical protein